MSSLTVTEPVDVDFPRLVDIMLAAFASPREPYIDIVYPLAHETPEGRVKAVSHMIQDWRNEPTATRWLKVTDNATGEIIAGARWSVYEAGHPWAEKCKARKADGGPGEGDDPVVAGWYPEGSDDREHAELVLGFVTNMRMKRAKGPHCHLEMLFVDPAHQRRGAGKKLVHWGVSKADELGIPASVESSLAGRHLYESYGFSVIESVVVPVPEKYKSRVPVRYMWCEREARTKEAGD